MGNSIPSACLTTSGRLTRDIAAQEADVSFARKKCGGSRAKFEELRNRAHKLLTSNRKADAFLMTDDIEDSKTTMQQDSQGRQGRGIYPTNPHCPCECSRC